LTPPPGRETVGHNYQKQSSEDSAEQPEGDLHTVRPNKLEQFRITLNQKLTRSDSTWITTLSIIQWLKSANRVRPCRLLSSIDTRLLLTEFGQKHDLISLVKSSPLIERKEVNQETWIRARPPQTDPILETIVTRRVIASPPPESHRPKSVGRLQVNPTDRATVESTEDRLDLVDLVFGKQTS
jgi:hypothetical protein